MMMEAIRSSKMSAFARGALRNIPEDCSLLSQCRENIKAYEKKIRPTKP
jgi:hypothetical protein